jgi:hypothetical protein
MESYVSGRFGQSNHCAKTEEMSLRRIQTTLKQRALVDRSNASRIFARSRTSAVFFLIRGADRPTVPGTRRSFKMRRLMRQSIKMTATSLLPVALVYVVVLIWGGVDFFYFFLLPSLWISVMAAYLTCLACRFSKWRGGRSKLYFGLLGTVAAGGLGACAPCIADRFLPGGWGPIDPLPFLLWFCVSGSVFGLLPSVLIARQYRRKFRDTAHAA